MTLKNRINKYYQLNNMLEQITFCSNETELIDTIYNIIELIVNNIDMENSLKYNNNKLICKNIKKIFNHIDDYTKKNTIIELKLCCIPLMREIIRLQYITQSMVLSL